MKKLLCVLLVVALAAAGVWLLSRTLLEKPEPTQLYHPSAVATAPEEETSEPTQPTTEPPTEAPTEAPTEPEDDTSWMLTLVNAEHPVPEDAVPTELTDLFNGEQVDSRIYPALQQMFDDARAQGVYPVVNEGYRTHERQQQIMEQRVQEYIAQGYEEAAAQELAQSTVAVPGTSEHELGLALDIIADTEKCDNETVYSWLRDNAYKYGFILRYPEDKVDITGIDFEPWHYRYVGTEAAQEIYQQGICLEEYLQ